MIHEVTLPRTTLDRLTDIVVLQMWLLRYAASTPSPSQTGCATHLERYRGFRGRGDRIARWIWNARDRREPLLSFAARGKPAKKREWTRLLSREALMFLTERTGTLTLMSKRAPSWQKNAAGFLRKFYDDLCSEAGLPSYLFSGSQTTSFGRQAFLREFQSENPGLYVCAVCDGSGFRTMVNSNVLTDIDHYLPQSLYPHLACHPYNMIPVCHLCNSGVKGTTDPLRGRRVNGRWSARRNLEDVVLPYYEPGLGVRTFLQVELGPSPLSARLGPLKYVQSNIEAPRLLADAGRSVRLASTPPTSRRSVLASRSP